MRTWFPHLLATLALCISSFGADHYVCQGSTGSGSGLTWSDACTGFQGNCAPGNLTRGDKYWVAAGNYASTGVAFNTPDSGNLVITIQAATDSAHGSSSTGWTDAGSGTCHQGQAIFRAPVSFTTDYWEFNGAHRGSGTGNPSIDWRTGYGFVVNNDNNGTPYNSNAALLLGDGGYTTTVNNITIRYVEISGSHDTTATYSDKGLWINSAQGKSDTNIYVGYSWSHDVGNAWFTADSVTNWTLEYSWGQNNESGAAHGEGVQIRCSGPNTSPTGVDANLTLRYNYFENSEGTGYIATPCNSDILPSNWYIYGNVFFGNSAEGTGRGYGDGNGAIALWNFTKWSGDLLIYNNTFSLISQQGGAGSCDIEWVANNNPTMGRVSIQNNTWYGCSQGVNRVNCPGVCSSFTYNSNSYFSTPTNDTIGSPNSAQIASGNPFVNVGQTKGANNFQLSADTSLWTSLSSPFNIDLNGALRSTSRGAFQFNGQTGALAPPTALSALVQ